MTTKNILYINSIQSELNSTLSAIAKDFDTSQSVASFEEKLKSSMVSQISNLAKTVNANNNNCSTWPPGSGFRVTVEIQIQVSYKIRFRTNVNVGYGQRSGNFSGSGSLHIAAYNAGLGTAQGRNNLVVDITTAANLVVGAGQGTPLQSYSLNYNSPIPLQNDFNKSIGYGQLITWNSAQSEGKFSLSDIQREGMIGFRIFDANVSTNNDTTRLYFGGDTDKGWTGGLSIVTPFMEIGFQDFSGDYLRFDSDMKPIEQEKRRDELIREIKEIKNSNIDKASKKLELEIKERELLDLTRGKFHQQTAYQKSLNKASTYLRFSNNGANITLDVIGDAWLQNYIHKVIKDFRFEYEHKKIDLWGGFQSR